MKIFPETFRQYNLLEHPFYVAWNEGRLTCAQLSLYAKQYGSFISLISNGWQCVHENEIAAEEHKHYELWQAFGNSLNHEAENVCLSAVEELVNKTQENYKTYAGALGALYAFEAQQPATSASKLEGLKEHYSTWNVDETYFAVHADDDNEPALLEEKIDALSEPERQVAATSCSVTCRLLYNALTDIYKYTNNKAVE